MTNPDILLFDKTFLDVEETYKIDGVDYLYDLVVSRSSFLGFCSRFINKKKLYYLVAKSDFISSLFIIFIRALKVLVIKINRKPKIIQPKTVGLLSCDLIISRSKSAELFESIDSWFLLPFTHFENTEVKLKTISVFDFIGFKDIISSYLKSVGAIFYSNGTNNKVYVRRLYVSFEFFLVKKALEKLSLDTKLVFANHKDRWAILYDSLPQTTKVLIQHGAESIVYNYPVKLNNISVLYAFNEDSYNILSKTILDCAPEVRFLKPTIELKSLPEDGKMKVLIVSPLVPFKERETYLIQNLQYEDLEIYVKPHYQNNDYSFYETLNKDYSFYIIKGQVFPRVDVVISYESTLVIEYQMHNVKVLLYENDSLEGIVNKVLCLKNSKIY